MESDNVDLLIIGSGPVGATFARQVLELCLNPRVMIVDAGPHTSATLGRHIRNLPLAERDHAAALSQGITQNDRPADARPGTHLVHHHTNNSMPGAAMSTCVGGMGVHWTCATPRPGNTERIPFIDNNEWNVAITRAEQLLHVGTQALPMTSESQAMQAVLQKTFEGELANDRPVQAMPLACQRRADGTIQWTASEDILEPLASDPRLMLRANTLCKKLIYAGARATGAVLEDRTTRTLQTVNAKVVVVAADTLRTPQLLWASGIRPPALGHYLNDQPELFAQVTLRKELLDAVPNESDDVSLAQAQKRNPTEALMGVLWVPFNEPTHRFHGQIMHMNLSPTLTESPAEYGASAQTTAQTVALAWFCPKDIRFEDCIEFSATEYDAYGLPNMRITYSLNECDNAVIAAAKVLLSRAAQAIGNPVAGFEPKLLPNGSSLHYQGTVRMGEVEDGKSVCNSHSQVWGFQNLFVGGNGVIPTATACNTTLMSVAIAVRASQRIAELLNG